MIDKWLNAGAVEDGLLHRTTEGSPQGGVISPCLSNIFLHHVLDEWFEFEVRSRLKGRCTLIRFADDAVLAFEDFFDAKRVLGVLGKRLARYGPTLHHDKTRFVDFRKNGVGRSTSRVSVPITVPRWTAVLAAATRNARFYWINRGRSGRI